jgi:hypothetical protein
VWFNVTFAILARSFEYPDILRRPTDEILSRFRAGGSRLILQWWAFMLSGVVFLPAAVLLPYLTGGNRLLVSVAVAVGILAAIVQVIGLLRWVYLVPYLARVHADTAANPSTREAVGIVFQSLHRFLGVGVGEHLGYLFTGAWTMLTGIAMISGTAFASWLGWVGIVLGAGLAVGSTEFLGPHEERGWDLAGKAVPILYILWSLWLLVLGVMLLLTR